MCWCAEVLNHVEINATFCALLIPAFFPGGTSLRQVNVFWNCLIPMQPCPHSLPSRSRNSVECVRPTMGKGFGHRRESVPEADVRQKSNIHLQRGSPLRASAEFF